MSSSRTVMLIAGDRISEWISKGEVTNRYYNPGDFFSVVHLVLLHAEDPDPVALQKLVGRARLEVHRFPTGIPFFAATLGWQPFILRLWAKRLVALAREARPDVIRCHTAGLNSFLAMEIKRALGIPYAVSLHINPDENVRVQGRSVARRIRDAASERLEIRSLREADVVLPVYLPIVPYLERIGVERFEVAYNALNFESLQSKSDYRLHSPVRIVSVGRQFREKNPDNLIRAIAAMPSTELTLVGNGSYHERLKALASELGLLDRRIFFRPVVTNDELCRMLPEFDIFATHSDYWEISKSVLEPLLTGLPVILNRRPGRPVPELTPEICLLVENTVQGYRDALERLISDHSFRESLGRRSGEIARRQWAPAVTEAKFVDVYRRLLGMPSERSDAR